MDNRPQKYELDKKSANLNQAFSRRKDDQCQICIGIYKNEKKEEFHSAIEQKVKSTKYLWSAK